MALTAHAPPVAGPRQANEAPRPPIVLAEPRQELVICQQCQRKTMSQVGKHLKREGAGRGKFDLFPLWCEYIYMHSMYIYSVVTVSGFVQAHSVVTHSSACCLQLTGDGT